jgi:hypothetical protein
LCFAGKEKDTKGFWEREINGRCMKNLEIREILANDQKNAKLSPKG